MTTRSHKLTGTAKAVVGYLKDEAATLLRYLDGDESGFDQAWGKSAASLGLERGLSIEQFERVFNGQHPITGEQLAHTGYRKVERSDGTVETVTARTGAIDVVYGAPKSLAVLYVAASPEMRRKLDQIVLEAAHAAHDAMEASAKLARIPLPVTVGADGERHYSTQRVTADLITVPTLQYTARPTEESEARGAPGVDPQIHVHATTFTLCQVGDKFYTADEFGLKNRTNAKYRDAVFLGELARGLEDIGVEIDYSEFDRSKGGEIRWEVRGTDEDLRRYWSTNNERAWKIRREYEEKHDKPIDEVKLGEVLYATRRRKSKAAKQQDSHPNWELWRVDAERAGFTLGRFDEHSPISHDPFEAADELTLRLMSSNGLCISDAVFEHETIRPAVARCAVGLGFSPAELDGFARALTRDLVVVRDAVEPEHRLYTTQAIVDAEERIERYHGRKMDQWVSVTGPAGTGKSTAARVAVETIRSLNAVAEGESAHAPEAVKAAATGTTLNPEQLAAVHRMVRAGAGVDEVIVVSMAATTAERTGLKIKSDKWGSVESICMGIERGTIRPTSRTLLVVEEAGQMDTLRMDKLLEAVGDARVVSLGDSGQLSSISAAGWYTDGIERHGSVELTEVKRQKDQRDVEAAQDVRDGYAGRALENLAERGRVHEAPDDAERMAAVFRDYRGHREAGRKARDVRLVLDASNVEVDTANRFIQRDRVARGEIAPTGVEVTNEDGRRWELHENDQVILLSTVRVRGAGPVKNGTTGTIRKIDVEQGRMRVRLYGDREVNIPISAAVGLDYAKHIQKFQGGEVPVAMVMPGKGQTNRNSGYTALTRETDETHVYVSGAVGDLAERWTQVEQKESARAAFERVRGEQQPSELPAARSDELHIGDIELDPVELDDVDIPDGWKQRDPFDRGQRHSDPFDQVEPEDPWLRVQSRDPWDDIEPPEIGGGMDMGL